MSAPAASSGASFRTRAVRGTLWTGLRYAAEYSIRLASNLILTRLLFPEAFGLMALVNALMVGLAMFSDIGLAQSLVQSPRGDEPRFLRTAWTLQVLRGALLCAMAAALAGVMADFYGHSELRRFVPVAGLTALIGGFNSISLIRMQRHLALGRLAGIELTSQLIATGVTIGWAWLAPSVWALVGGAVLGTLLKVVLSYAFAPHDASGFGWERGAARQLLGFGKWIFLSTLLFFLAGQTDRLLFGKLFTVSMLGVYGIALVLTGLPTQLLWSIGNFVLLPAFSRLAESPAALESRYRSLQLPVLLLGGLPVAGLIACGPELVELLYDPRYADAGWMLQLLAFGAWFQIPQTLSGNVLLGLGGPHWMAIGNGTKLLGMLALVPGGYALFGVPGAIAGLSASEAFRWASYSIGVRRHALPGLRMDLACSLVALGVALAGHLSVGLAQDSGGGPFVRLCAGLAGMLLLWTPISAWLLRTELPGLWVRLKGRV